MKIGFFGDSFCGDMESRHNRYTDYETYINKLKKHYNAEIVNLGIGGCSIYDIILLQIKPFIDKNNYPDICIFIWANYRRLFHRTMRQGMWSTGVTNEIDPILNAAKQYLTYFSDSELQKFQYVSALQYFDLNTLSEFPKTTKILHLWGFEKLYNWKHGIEISIDNYKSLLELGSDGREIPKTIDPELNHIDGDRKNNLVFEKIKTAIDNYNAGTFNNKEITL